jgi:hypothetical protein
LRRSQPLRSSPTTNYPHDGPHKDVRPSRGSRDLYHYCHSAVY